jgi:hypothetical protein
MQSPGVDSLFRFCVEHSAWYGGKSLNGKV